jgi:predicted metal-dependent phosphoesterase TrpH
MLIDLHCHTKYSGDNRLEPLELIRSARSLGLDAICITEHDSFCASAPVEKIAKKEGFLVFRGVEINTDRGHVLAFGVKDDSWKKRRGYYSHISAVTPVVAAAGGILAPAHPFRMVGAASAANSLYEMDYIAAVEVLNGENNVRENDLAGQAWAKLDLPGIGGSDCHFAQDVGRCATWFDNTISCMEELIEEIKAGRVAPALRNGNGDCTRLQKPTWC